MAASPQKFLFDTSFDQPQGPIAVNFARKPAEPTFSRAELETARAAAAEEARQAALAEAAASLEQRLADAVEGLAAGVSSLLERDEEIRGSAERRAIELIRAVLARALPELTRVNPLAEIEAMIADCLREAFEEPRIVLRVPNDLFDPLRQRLGAIAQQSGFGGKFVILAEDALGPADCRLEWADGGAERDVRRLAHAIDAAIARALQTAAPKSEPSRQESQDE
jgi:flagellar assembly protein FliH